MPTPPAPPRTDPLPADSVGLEERELAAWKGFLRAHREVVARLDDELQRSHDLPLSSYEVLLYLAQSDDGRLRMGELADRLLLSRSGLTRLVDRLERRDLVEPASAARRTPAASSPASPRPAGNSSSPRVPTISTASASHYLSRLDDSDLENLTVAWRRLTG